MRIPGAGSRLVMLAMMSALLLAGCGSPDRSASPSMPDVEPIPIPGVQDCSQLTVGEGSQTADQGAGRLAAVTLPCLTAPGRVEASAIGGAPTIVNLWASWCGPCREEMPLLQDAAASLEGRIRFVGIDTLDDPARAADFVAEVGVTYPQLVDPDGLVLGDLGVPGLPVTVALDATGQVAGQVIGPVTDSDLDRLIASADGGS